MIHEKKHNLAGQTVRIKEDVRHPQYKIGGKEFVVEDWWDRVSGSSWMDDATSAWVAVVYAIRTGMEGLPDDGVGADEVVYGKVDGMGHLIHESELNIEEWVSC